MIRVLVQGLNIQLDLPISINILKMQSILLEFQLHKKKWTDLRVFVHIH